MQYKVAAALFFSTLALAAPAPQETSSSSVTNTNSDSDSESPLDAAVSNVPSSILTVLETAIPASWYENLANPTSESQMLAEIDAGTMPAWYNQLPASVKEWASTADLFDVAAATTAADADSTTTATANAMTAAEATSTGAVMTNTNSAAETTAASKKAESASASTSTASGSSSASATATHSTSTGGAPIATGSVAMSLAGAAGLLGLVIAL
ncbi:uncharacterized protein N7477_009384 [Penicillium maclennaniae]|uniref:uncharacterized protein n=1 Tax=Penicillium maclennaniae TaxID=1343394 RepID=UPI002540B66E|nr:uncharacterized protein N7477_009384 [Penicillium maclennaniae]KAJ5661768.1 hypothetical protein N7477_009384 [Penicillium maclennaniae]